MRRTGGTGSRRSRPPGSASSASGTADWSADAADRQIAAERNLLDAFADHGLHGWTRLADLTNLPPQTDAPRAFLLAKVVNALKGHRGLGIWKGVDEPANPFRPAPVPAAGLIRGHQLLRRELDQRHPNVIIQAPRGTAAELARYRPAFDITGADVYPVSYPPGVHAGKRGSGPGLVGDVTRKMVAAAGSKPVWTTLQIAWSGIAPSKTSPERVPRFPSLHDERFMAYQAIVAGARGLVFFGGHMTQVMTPARRRARLELDVLGARAAPARRGADLGRRPAGADGGRRGKPRCARASRTWSW